MDKKIPRLYSIDFNFSIGYDRIGTRRLMIYEELNRKNWQEWYKTVKKEFNL